MSNKLEETLAVIRQVMEQFKDPVRRPSICSPLDRVHSLRWCLGVDDVRLRLHSRVSLVVRDGTAGPRISQMSHRHAFDHRQSSSLQFRRGEQPLPTMPTPCATPAEISRTSSSLVSLSPCTVRCSLQIDLLYDDFHVVKLPLLDDEVRGVDQIRRFSQHLLQQYRLQ